MQEEMTTPHATKAQFHIEEQSRTMFGEEATSWLKTRWISSRDIHRILRVSVGGDN